MESKGIKIGFAGTLAIVFTVLKLTGSTTLSWWWVLAPVWIPAAIAVAAILGLVYLTVKKERSKR